MILALIAICGIFLPGRHVTAPVAGAINTGDVAWMLTSSALVLLMTPGLAFFYGGMVRYKNLVSTLLQNFIALGVVSVLWILVGFSIAFGDDLGGVVGNPLTYFMFKNVGAAPNSVFAATIPFALFAMFQLKFAIITPALITGGLAERVRFSSLLLFICLFSLFIYAPLAHWTWHPDGFLRKWGVLDFAGGTVVHISAGFAALSGAMMLGKRAHIEKHQIPTNIPYVLLGTGMLWFGWFGFNAGSALGANELATTAFVNTNLSSATAMVTWLFLDSLSGKKRSAVGAAVGAVVGLVAITPAAGYVDVGHSIFIGFFSSIISNMAVRFKSKTNIDDTLDVFPCHGLGGIVGMILTGVFAKGSGLIYGSTSLFLHHLLALLIVSIFTFGGSYLLYMITNFIVPLRVTPEQEEKGLDITQHGEEATDWRVRMKSL
ncbi:MAG: ammonium transporter [Bacteroidota bacterium]|nr:ammonium transporter [Bacteroidota bacterium]MDP4225261.1 ammonium transporter [Bacteroidota bacterium]MDP4275207.1 ammonium transporter [Bacteroidota bacterium]